MTVEELLKPRYKVIADYPNSGYSTYDMIEFEQDFKGRPIHRVWNKDGHADYAPAFYNRYPHLFKLLDWWEERKESDMPEYVKLSGFVDSHDKPVPDSVFKVVKHFSGGTGNWRDDSIKVFYAENKKCANYSGFLPATKEEYETYKSTTKI